MAISFTCPAARPFHPVDSDLPGCVCGVIRNANVDEQIDGWTERGQVGEVLHPRADASSLVAYCTRSYTDCPVWRAERERQWAGRSELGGLQADSVRKRAPNPGRDRAYDALISGMRAAA